MSFYTAINITVIPIIAFYMKYSRHIGMLCELKDLSCCFVSGLQDSGNVWRALGVLCVHGVYTILCEPMFEVAYVNMLVNVLETECVLGCG